MALPRGCAYERCYPTPTLTADTLAAVPGAAAMPTAATTVPATATVPAAATAAEPAVTALARPRQPGIPDYSSVRSTGLCRLVYHLCTILCNCFLA